MLLKKLYFILNLFILLIISNNTILANNIKNSAVIFMYHKFDTSKYPSTNIKSDQFESHLNEFKKEKYNVLSLDYIVDTIINDGDLPANSIGISIDDADKSILNYAWPRLKEKGYPVTLFINTSSISSNNYLNWDEIRYLKNQGVTIGSHSHTHGHLSNLSVNEIKKEIEKSNKIFLQELGEIPNLFAYPYGEANEEIIEVLKSYKYKVAFGQHSGVVNETSNFYYLPRFSLNEKYGDLERVKFAANAKGLGVYDFIPINPTIIDNPPYIGFSLLDNQLASTIDCFIFDGLGRVDSEIFKFNERIEIRLNRKLKEGRSRLNCTAKDKGENWRWFGHQFFLQN